MCLHILLNLSHRNGNNSCGHFNQFHRFVGKILLWFAVLNGLTSATDIAADFLTELLNNPIHVVTIKIPKWTKLAEVGNLCHY